MQANLPTDDVNSVSRANLLTPYLWLTILTPLLVLIQAVLAGQGFFDDTDLLDIHARLGDIFFLVTLVQLVLTALLRIRGPIAKPLLIMNATLVILTFIQLFLGYNAADNPYGQPDQAAAWHLPNGVLIFGLSGAIHGMVRRLQAGRTS